MKKKVSRFFVTIVMVLCLSTATFAETKAMTGSNLETSSLQFETVYTDIWEYVKEYREVSMYAENLVYVVLRRKGKTNYETDTFHEWNYDELFERLIESGEEYDDDVINELYAVFAHDQTHLSFDEFLNYVKCIQDEDETALLKYRFECIDTDHNGNLDPMELQAFEKLCGNLITIEEAEQLVKEMDKDGDGKVTLDDFIRYKTE